MSLDVYNIEISSKSVLVLLYHAGIDAGRYAMSFGVHKYADLATGSIQNEALDVDWTSAMVQDPPRQPMMISNTIITE